MAKKTPTEPVVETNRIVEILKSLESKHKELRADLQWMTGDGVVSDITSTSSGILSLDLALGIGGYPHGRIIEVYGPESAGKTTLTLHAIAAAQKAGGIAAFIDAEHALDTGYAAKVGVDVQNLLIDQPDSGEKALGMAVVLSEELTKGDIIVVDSVAALTPQAELDGAVGDSHVGLQARLMGQGLRKLTSSVSKSGVIVYFTNQIRYKIGVMFGNPETTSGGNALKFYASVRLDVRRKAKIKKGEDVIGNLTEIKVVKNKVAPPYKIAETEIRYGEGVPRALDILLCGMNCGVVEKSGAWLNYKENRLGQGKDNAWDMLKGCPDILDEIEKAVRTHYGI